MIMAIENNFFKLILPAVNYLFFQRLDAYDEDNF